MERNGVGDWGSAMVTTQKNYSPTNPGPAAMTVAQIDQHFATSSCRTPPICAAMRKPQLRISRSESRKRRG